MTSLGNCQECGIDIPVTSYERWRQRKRKFCSRQCSGKSRRKGSVGRSNPTYQKEYGKRIRAEAIAHYGGKCVCCGETIQEFLTFDHPNNDGFKDRLLRPGNKLVLWLRSNDYPDVVQIMCFNCNCGRAKNNGVCPHKGQ